MDLFKIANYGIDGDKVNKKHISRREFLQLIGFGGAAILTSGILSNCKADDLFLPITPTENPTKAITPDIEIELNAVQDDFQIFEGNKTQVWRYQGKVLEGPEDSLKIIPNSYLGPTFNVTKGQTLRIHFTNELPEESIIHWHGLHVPVEADGHPNLAIKPGETYIYDFTALNRAGTYWYHPHPHGRTGIQAYRGLAGLFLISDDEEINLGLPKEEFDVPLVIQDRLFNNTNQLVYSGNNMMNQMMGFLGNKILVNGQPDYTLSVATRPYRLRILNGSNSRIYKLGWEDGTPMTIIGTDGGLLETPISKNYITLAPAQRVDLWADFNGREVGEQIRLVNLPSDTPGGENTFPIMTIDIKHLSTEGTTLPERLSEVSLLTQTNAVNRLSPREFKLAMGRGMIWTINGRTFDMNDVARDEIVKLGDTEVWQFSNQNERKMGMMGGMALPHPMHIHGLQFQVIEREINAIGKNSWSTINEGVVDAGWHDTVLVMPGERVKVLLKFEDFTGLYLFHCHNLEHEDMGMMRNFLIKS